MAAQYSNLEYELAQGRRGERDAHVRKVLNALLGAPSSIVVNNNAAAVLITLNTLAEGGEVIVSRGELIEIGGSFRIPEIMAKSGALLREVGTTNRTRIGDYRKALNERTKLLLRVHPSNFRVVGFTESPALDELVSLSRETGIPVFEDLGSGCLLSMAEQGIPDEHPAGESIAAGVDVVSFSGDKLLGGPQAGVIAGRKELVEGIRRNPLFRAMRVDKLTYSVLEATLRDYWLGHPERIPAIRMIRMARDQIEQRAKRLMAACGETKGVWSMEMADGESVLGGGAAPGQTIPTRLVALRHAKHSAAVLEKRLRSRQPPVIAPCRGKRRSARPAYRAAGAGRGLDSSRAVAGSELKRRAGRELPSSHSSSHGSWTGELFHRARRDLAERMGAGVAVHAGVSDDPGTARSRDGFAGGSERGHGLARAWIVAPDSVLCSGRFVPGDEDRLLGQRGFGRPAAVGVSDEGADQPAVLRQAGADCGGPAVSPEASGRE